MRDRKEIEEENTLLREKLTISEDYSTEVWKENRILKAQIALN